MAELVFSAWFLKHKNGWKYFVYTTVTVTTFMGTHSTTKQHEIDDEWDDFFLSRKS